MMPQISELKSFREELYMQFPKRKDAIMNLLDALTSHGHQCNSVVQLSKASCYDRKYSSITDAIADGLPSVDWQKIEFLVYRYLFEDQEKKLNRFLLDCTGNPRPYAQKLADRTITHSPNPVPGNKPICVGHQYSLLALLPNDIISEEKHWITPLSFKRVKSEEKGNEIGVQQVIDCIDRLGLSDQLSVSIGDSLYGTENCRIKASKQDKLIHIFRLNSKRNLYCKPEQKDKAGKGRKQEFGKKMILNDISSHPEPDIKAQTTWTSRKNKEYKVFISCWQDMLLRGSRQFRSSKHPINLIKICVEDQNGKMLYKKPLWLAVFGNFRNEISLIECYQNYSSRYDIEHFFRFGKRKLLIGAYQTPDLEHEELWWNFCLLAYAQLYLGRTLTPLLPEPWERYLPEYKSTDMNDQNVTTPSQTQRGFHKILKEIGSPAEPCIARGNPCGRINGELLQKRNNCPIIFKGQKSEPKSPEVIISELEQSSVSSNNKRIADLLSSVQLSIKSLKISSKEFAKMLVDTG
jgi:hypothetical protein